jgi:hypothetical protein
MPLSGGLLLTIPAALIFWMSRLWIYLKISRNKSQATKDFRAAVGELDTFYAGINTKYDLRAADPLKALGELDQKRLALLFTADNLNQTINHLSEGQGIEYLDEPLEIGLQINRNRSGDVICRRVARLPEMQETTANRYRQTNSTNSGHDRTVPASNAS